MANDTDTLNNWERFHEGSHHKISDAGLTAMRDSTLATFEYMVARRNQFGGIQISSLRSDYLALQDLLDQRARKSANS